MLLSLVKLGLNKYGSNKKCPSLYRGKGTYEITHLIEEGLKESGSPRYRGVLYNIPVVV